MDDIFFLDNFKSKYFLINNKSVAKYHYKDDIQRLLVLAGEYEITCRIKEEKELKNRIVNIYEVDLNFIVTLVGIAKKRLDR